MKLLLPLLLVPALAFGVATPQWATYKDSDGSTLDFDQSGDRCVLGVTGRDRTTTSDTPRLDLDGTNVAKFETVTNSSKAGFQLFPYMAAESVISALSGVVNVNTEDAADSSVISGNEWRTGVLIAGEADCSSFSSTTTSEAVNNNQITTTALTIPANAMAVVFALGSGTTETCTWSDSLNEMLDQGGGFGARLCAAYQTPSASQQSSKTYTVTFSGTQNYLLTWVGYIETQTGAGGNSLTVTGDDWVQSKSMTTSPAMAAGVHTTFSVNGDSLSVDSGATDTFSNITPTKDDFSSSGSLNNVKLNTDYSDCAISDGTNASDNATCRFNITVDANETLHTLAGSLNSSTLNASAEVGDQTLFTVTQGSATIDAAGDLTNKTTPLRIVSRTYDANAGTPIWLSDKVYTESGGTVDPSSCPGVAGTWRKGSDFCPSDILPRTPISITDTTATLRVFIPEGKRSGTVTWGRWDCATSACTEITVGDFTDSGETESWKLLEDQNVGADAYYTASAGAGDVTTKAITSLSADSHYKVCYTHNVNDDRPRNKVVCSVFKTDVASSADSLYYVPGQWIRGSPGSVFETGYDLSSVITPVCAGNGKHLYEGVQIYPYWRTIETSVGVYDFAMIEAQLSDLATQCSGRKFRAMLNLSMRALQKRGKNKLCVPQPYIDNYNGMLLGANLKPTIKSLRTGCMADLRIPEVKEAYEEFAVAVATEYSDDPRVAGIYLKGEWSITGYVAYDPDCTPDDKDANCIPDGSTQGGWSKSLGLGSDSSRDDWGLAFMEVAEAVYNAAPEKIQFLPSNFLKLSNAPKTHAKMTSLLDAGGFGLVSPDVFSGTKKYKDGAYISATPYWTAGQSDSVTYKGTSTAPGIPNAGASEASGSFGAGRLERVQNGGPSTAAAAVEALSDASMTESLQFDDTTVNGWYHNFHRWLWRCETSLDNVKICLSDVTDFLTTETGLVGIASITKANPGVITTDSAHGISNGDVFRVRGDDMVELNGGYYKAANVTSTTVEIQDMSGTNVNTTSYTTSTGTGVTWNVVGWGEAGCPSSGSPTCTYPTDADLD